MTKQQAYTIFHALKKHYPHAHMILQWNNHWELLASIILSAQCTDKKVNEVTEKVFPKYMKERQEFLPKYNAYKKTMLIPTSQIIQLVNFAYVPIEELEEDIRSTGFYHNKAKNIQTAAKTVLDTYHGTLPKTISLLTTIPGVGRKTANVFLGNAYHIYEGIAVDTHVQKQSRLLHLTNEISPENIEKDLMKIFDKKDWFTLAYLLIEHGRNMRKKEKDRITCHDKNCILGI